MAILDGDRSIGIAFQFAFVRSFGETSNLLAPAMTTQVYIEKVSLLNAVPKRQAFDIAVYQNDLLLLGWDFEPAGL